MRYLRQEVLPFIPNNFNEVSSKLNLVLVGCGGVGSVLAELLVRGGFTNLILIDNDIVDESNLGRQIFFEEDVGKFKVFCLKNYLLKINSKANIKVFNELLDENNIYDICLNSDLIIDASDNFKIRRIINDFCEKNNIDYHIKYGTQKKDNKETEKIFREVENCKVLRFTT